MHEDGGDDCHGHLEGERGGKDPSFSLAKGSVESRDEACTEQEGADRCEGLGPG